MNMKNLTQVFKYAVSVLRSQTKLSYARVFKVRRSSRAFTLVESMVAISILSLAVTGPLLIAQKGIGSAIYARDQIMAFYLAQEAVEYIRNVRDSNRMTGTPWLSQFSSCNETGAGERCQIDARYDYSPNP